MSDLFAPNGVTNGTSHPMAAPQAPASGMRTPTDVMRSRQARNARKQEEAERQQLLETERQTRAQEEERRKNAERRAMAAGLSQQQQPPQQAFQSQRVRDSGYRSVDPSVGGLTPAQPPLSSPPVTGGSSQFAPSVPSNLYDRRDPLSSSFQPASLTAELATRTARQPPQQQQQTSTQPANPQTSRPQTASTAQPTYRQPSGQQSQATSTTTKEPPPVIASSGQQSSGGSGAPARASNTSSFPHAFERWETLSSHWEGLTSYWIRRMEQHNEEIRRDPIAQQMSRQITDLSAAGANLFHAVVELQRLRASSERKFQRWFFETRAEQERAQATQADLRRALDEEKVRSVQNVQVQQQQQQQPPPNLEADRRLLEMRRELQISRDECRRAWEELGRREQLERDRVFSLRQGNPVDIGGVQVVPQGAPSRGASLQRPEAFTQQTAMGGSVTPNQPHYTTFEQGSPTSTDPYSSSERAINPQMIQTIPFAQYSSDLQNAGPDTVPRNIPGPQQFMPNAPASSQRQAENYYRQDQSGFVQSQGQQVSTDPNRQSIISEESDDDVLSGEAAGQVQIGPGGNTVQYQRNPPSDIQQGQATAGRDEFLAEDTKREEIRAQAFGRSESSGQVPQAQYGQRQDQEPADYEGESWAGAGGEGEGTTWEEIQKEGLHSQPTRLSRVSEEDERSRTSGAY